MADRDFPQITDDYDVEIANPDDHTQVPIASGSLAQISELIVEGRYTGQAWSPEGEDPVPVDVLVRADGAVASHKDDPRGVANPQHLARREALVKEVQEQPRRDQTQVGAEPEL